MSIITLLPLQRCCVSTCTFYSTTSVNYFNLTSHTICRSLRWNDQKVWSWISESLTSVHISSNSLTGWMKRWLMQMSSESNRLLLETHSFTGFLTASKAPTSFISVGLWWQYINMSTTQGWYLNFHSCWMKNVLFEQKNIKLQTKWHF